MRVILNFIKMKRFLSMNFLITIWKTKFINPKDKNKFLHKFYINRRKELNIFMQNGKPFFDKYSFDEDNRKKLPKDIKIPPILAYENSFIKEAKEYCKKFKSVEVCEYFYYPTTFEEAFLQLNYFLKEKFENFGTYQDAITKDTKQSFLFHSNISSSLNIGLFDLNELIEKIVNSQSPYNAKEGFIRQIIGWREFMLRVYEDDEILLRNSNFFEFKNPIPKKIIEAKSGIQILDDSIKKLELTAYNHHIERLMI